MAEGRGARMAEVGVCAWPRSLASVGDLQHALALVDPSALAKAMTFQVVQKERDTFRRPKGPSATCG